MGGQTNMGWERHGGGDGGKGSRPGTRKGDWIRVGVVSLTAPIRVFTQRHRIPLSTPSPAPPPTVQTWLCKEVPRVLWNSYNGWHGVWDPKEICVPLPCPPHPSQNLTPSPQDLVLLFRDSGLPPTQIPITPPRTWGLERTFSPSVL